MLIIVASKPMPFAGVDFSKYEEEIKQAQALGHKQCIMEYLHGSLAEKCGYDIGLCINAELCVDFDNECYKEGIYAAWVEGTLCKAYLWNAGSRHRGLIVDASNKEDVEFAEKKYTEKAMFL